MNLINVISSVLEPKRSLPADRQRFSNWDLFRLILPILVEQLIKEGKILHWGLSAVTEDIIRCAHAVCPVTAIQNIYSMLERDTENLFPVLEALNIGLVTHCPLASGTL